MIVNSSVESDMDTDTLCPCGTLRDYSNCCGPIHSGLAKAESAEQLMRSRFSAFSRENIDYIVDTTHHNYIANSDKAEIEKSVMRFKWLRLDILNKKAGTTADKHGIVEFTAHFVDTLTGQTGSVTERSNFLKVKDKWFYTDGETKQQQAKVRRNDPCWCGSGKKFKKCHGAQ